MLIWLAIAVWALLALPVGVCTGRWLSRIDN